jgi:hypothetical protein
MKVDFRTLILDHKGNPIKEADGDLTLGDVTSLSLLMAIEDDKKIDGKEKTRRFKLALKAEGEQDLSVADVQMIMDRVGKTHPTLICGRVWEILDPELKPDLKIVGD